MLIAFDRSRSSYAVIEPPGGCSGANCIGGKKQLFDVFETTKELVVDELVLLLDKYGFAPFFNSQDIRFAATSFSSDVTVDFDFKSGFDFDDTRDAMSNICDDGSCDVRSLALACAFCDFSFVWCSVPVPFNPPRLRCFAFILFGS